MVSAKKLITVFTIVVLGLVSQLQAEPGVTYTGKLTGIDCDGCKRSIASSIAKFKGVKTIKIVKKSSGSHVMTVATNGAKAISKTEVSNALGKDSHYKIVSWKSRKTS
tara:strand:+ start:377 stop:700 length:324 start_codon:yes stop_codon:yes gene_type:complete